MSSRQPGHCLWCDSTDVRELQHEAPAGNPAQGIADGSNGPPRSGQQWACGNCGRTWSHLPLKIRRGEVVETARGPIKVTAADAAWLRPIRAFLLEVFAQDRRVDTAELKERVGLPHDIDEVGRLLELLTADCTRRGEPSLSALVSGVPEPTDERSGASTELISQEEINDLLDGAYGGTEQPGKPDPAPEPA